MTAGGTPRWRRLLGQETITEPLPVIDRLRNTPYRNPRRNTFGDERLREALELVADVGQALLLAGAGTAEVSTSMLATGVALGLDEEHLWSDITLGSVLLSYNRPDTVPVTLLRVARFPSRNYATLSAVHGLVVDLVAGDLEHDQARRRLVAITEAPRPYRRWWVTIAWGVLSAAVVVVLGGGHVVATTAFVVTMLVDRVGRWANRRGWRPFFVTLTGAAIAATSAVALAEISERWPIGLDQPQNSSLVIAGGIIVLLAGVGLVAAGQDGINGYPVTAIGRLYEVGLTTSAILCGVALVLSLASAADLAGTIFTNPLDGKLGGFYWWSPPLAAAGSIMAAIGGRAPLRLLATTGLCGAIGYATLQVGVLAGLSDPISTALGSVLVGSLGRVWALRRHASPMAVVLPATTMLLPGLSIFQGLQLLTSGDSASGIVTLLGAGATGLAIGAGCVLGDFLASPLESGMSSLDEVRARLAHDL